MEVSITKFRHDLFDLVNRALAGTDVWVVHKGRRFKIAPEQTSGSRLSRITPLDIINPKPPDPNQPSLQEEMERAWEKDWRTL
jgi:antitoxin (DNA-binding transcriptional repressor) of toxin-antitoxin stability system